MPNGWLDPMKTVVPAPVMPVAPVKVFAAFRGMPPVPVLVREGVPTDQDALWVPPEKVLRLFRVSVPVLLTVTVSAGFGAAGLSWITSLITSAPAPPMVRTILGVTPTVMVDGAALDPRIMAAPADMLELMVRPV